MPILRIPTIQTRLKKLNRVSGDPLVCRKSRTKLTFYRGLERVDLCLPRCPFPLRRLKVDWSGRGTGDYRL
jgi:hypothetical protein